MVSLVQKLKMPKRCEKRLYELIRVGVYKKLFLKTLNIRKMRAILKLIRVGVYKKQLQKKLNI